MQNNTHWDIYRKTSKQGILFARVHINTLLLQHFFLSQMQTYSKSLLTEISAKSTFRIGFDFKEVNISLSLSVSLSVSIYIYIYIYIYTLRYLLYFVMITTICLSWISLTYQKWALLKMLTMPFNDMTGTDVCDSTA